MKVRLYIQNLVFCKKMRACKPFFSVAVSEMKLFLAYIVIQLKWLSFSIVLGRNRQSTAAKIWSIFGFTLITQFVPIPWRVAKQS